MQSISVWAIVEYTIVCLCVHFGPTIQYLVVSHTKWYHGDTQ